MAKSHTILGGKVHVYKRDGSPLWQCYTYLNGKKRRSTTKKESLAQAKEVAEDWYLELRGKKVRGELIDGPTFKQAAKQFELEYETITQGKRSPKWVQGHKDRIRLHLLPYFANTPLSEINSGTTQEYRVHRMTNPDEDSKADDAKGDTPPKDPPWKPPAQNTLHNEIVTLSMVLRTAVRHGWIDHIPDLSDPYRRKSKIEHRPWFTPKQYKQLYEATRKNAAKPPNKHFAWHAKQLHDYVLFMVNTGLRPDEAKVLEYQDVEIITDEWSGDRILLIEVRGKRGVGYCKSMPGAVHPFERMKRRNKPEPTDRLFPNEFKKMFNRILVDSNLKYDRNGKALTTFSLRHSYICFRLLEGADIYQVAKNCRTSVEMIEKHYAAHLKDMIDTSLVNVRKPKPKAKRSTKQTSKA